MKKLAVLNSFAALLILAVALILFSGPAQAYVYDNFSTPGIDPSLWTDTGPNYGLFSQPGDGYLNFSDPNPGGQKDSLRSFNSVSGAFFVSMQYLNFQSTNNQPPGQSKSSGVHLNLSDGTNIVNAQECKNDVGNFFQGYSYIDGLQTQYAPTLSAVNSGWLGIGYNGILGKGGLVTLWYDAGTGWTQLATCAPDFSQNPYFSIMGKNLYGTALSFQVDQVQVIPLPPSVLLLGTGLLSLAGFRRFRKG